ncbi:hypothetical protein [Amycolatopsis plumensis]|uniref:Uncharacterized protein n=1 Tax=Amycolatopsis plumensis TaxID=236508 RepID=A0ABV5UKP1_9PSEU
MTAAGTGINIDCCMADADVHHCRADTVAGTPAFVLDGVDDFRVSDGRPVPEARVGHADHQEL